MQHTVNIPNHLILLEMKKMKIKKKSTTNKQMKLTISKHGDHVEKDNECDENIDCTN